MHFDDKRGSEPWPADRTRELDASESAEAENGAGFAEGELADGPPREDEAEIVDGDGALVLPTTASARESAGRIGEIIDDAQRSAREFIDEAQRQAGLIIREAEDEGRERRAELVGEAREQIDALIETAEAMLADASELAGRVAEMNAGLKDASERLRAHVDDLVGPAEDLDPEPELEETSVEHAPLRRRFGLR